MWWHATTIAHSCVQYWSVHVVAKYKHRYEDNTQYPFYTVAVKHETGELMTLTHTLAETKVQNDFISSMIKKIYSMIIHQYTYTRVTLNNTTWWQGKEYRDVNMTCTQECAIVVACHHIMNMHDGN